MREGREGEERRYVREGREGGEETCERRRGRQSNQVQLLQNQTNKGAVPNLLCLLEVEQC